MWGRAGRRGRGLAVYIAGEDALDQFFCRHPDEFLDAAGRGGDPRPRERGDPSRAPRCAPRTRARSTAARRRVARPGVAQADAERLVRTGELRERARTVRAARAGATIPAARVSLRSASPDRFAIVDVELRRDARHRRGGARATRPSTRARSTCTSGAAYEVRELDLDAAPGAASSRSTATGTRSRSGRPRPAIERLLDRRDAQGVSCPSAR